MPYSYHIDPERRRATIVVEGEITGFTFVEVIRALVDDASWDPLYDRLWDARGITSLVLTAPELATLLQEVGRTRGGARRSAVVVSRDIDELAATLYCKRMGRWPVGIFYSLAKALAWLEEPET